MSNSAWCDLNRNGTIPNLHDKCPNSKCNYQRQITFTPRQYELEGGGFKNKFRKISLGRRKPGIVFLKPAVNVAAPFIRMTVRAKTKNPRMAHAPNIMKSMSGGVFLSLTDMYGKGFRLKVM